MEREQIFVEDDLELEIAKELWPIKNWKKTYLDKPDFIDSNFSKPQPDEPTNIKLEKMFTAPNIERIAGIKIRWTDELVDHLRLVEDGRAVVIFRHASFLKWQCRFVHMTRSATEH